jgi:hypothetical protein
MATIEQPIDELIRGPQYATPQSEKDATLTPILRALCRSAADHCSGYRRFLDRFGGELDAWQSPADVPPLPASMFKHFLLSSIPPEKVVRELRSSSTTGQQPSRIVIDKTTAFRQSRALVSILKEHLGTQRRPFLVFDAAESVGQGDQLTARGAAIRGVANFASETVFALKKDSSGELSPDWNCIDGFFARRADASVLLFGFTFIVWTRFLLRRLEKARRGSGLEKRVHRACRIGAWCEPSQHSGFLRHGRAGGHGFCGLSGGQQACPGLCRRDPTAAAHRAARRHRRDRHHRSC